jgi:hypothetical protein
MDFHDRMIDAAERAHKPQECRWGRCRRPREKGADWCRVHIEQEKRHAAASQKRREE